ncbi:hypothetical protein H1235_12240 [Pseudoxanthomonas sp. NC8]|nr:hypothetical protein H1235_12240 [Pseudoxanthomonas sp. NC8]
MNIKRHRVVASESPFQGVANALQDRAVQCAENEGWPIPGDAPEPLLAMAQASVVHCATAQMGGQPAGGIHFQSGRSCAYRRIVLPTRHVGAIQWHAGAQASRP